MASEQLQKIKTPLTPLAGPYGHPFHPIAVTLPIGSWTASIVFDVLSQRAREPRIYGRGSADLVKLGIVGAVGAALLGFVDYVKIPKRSKAGVTASTHMALNLAIVALYSINLVQREKRLADDRMRDAPVTGGELGLSALALALLGASGFLGGVLAYTFGVRVADEVTQAEGLAPV